ncbi:MAG: FAD-dependent oxidoreductase, partial [Candidatus Latescibacterota bacterium]|nr:FAD-dependent oxidoreductase [Candidatus Latescibacterota bacterium]
MADSTYDVLVLGGGINGRCALFHLMERGIDRVGLVERFDLDLSRGSSHSHSRVTRSAYVN